MGNMDQDVTKKLKGLDGNAVPVSYISSTGNSVEASESFEQNEDDFIGGDDGNNEIDPHMQAKNGSKSMQSAVTDNVAKINTQVPPNTEGDRNFTTSTDPVRTTTACFSHSAGEKLPFDATVRDEKQLKREKRKQANRESARRSRMRKQAEYEELVKSCDSLITEQMDLQSELERVKVDAEKLRLENAALREKLKSPHSMQEGGTASSKTEADVSLPNDAKDILSNLGSVSSDAQLDCEKHETSISETVTRLHQLLESSSDAVAAR